MPKVEGKQKYFTAQEAREVSNEVISHMLSEELDFVYEKIDNARFNGDIKVTLFNKDLMNSTKEFLRSKGFKVEHYTGSQWDPCNDTTISW